MAYNFIITSDDYAATSDKIDAILKSFNKDFDQSTYDMEDDSLYSLIDDISTISLFDDPKFIIVKSSEAILKSSEKPFNELLKAISDPASENVLVFLFGVSYDTNDEKYKAMSQFASVIKIRIKNMSLEEALDKLIVDEGYIIDIDAKKLLLSYVTDLATLKQYIEMLKCYKMLEKRITQEDISKMVNPPLEDNVYNLAEAVLEKNKKRVFSCLKDFKIQNVQASYLVSLLINKFQEMYNVSILLRSGASKEDITQIFNVTPGRAYYMVKNAKSSSIESIKSNLNKLNKLDFEIKSGITEQNLGLELFLLG